VVSVHRALFPENRFIFYLGILDFNKCKILVILYGFRLSKEPK
jgi:hypothetical protein